MKKYLILPILLLLAVAAYFYFSTNVVEAPKVDEYVPEETFTKQDLSIKDSSKQIIEDGYEVDFKFPVTGVSEIDSEVVKAVDSIIGSFAEEAVSFLPHPAGFERAYTLNGAYKHYTGGEYNSFVFLVSVDFGGAHPNHFYKTLTFDRYNTVVSIEDFLVSEANGLQSISLISKLTQEIILNRLGQDANLDMIEDGAGPYVDNFKNYYVDDSAVVFVFEPYAVAAYAYSSQEARISLFELK